MHEITELEVTPIKFKQWRFVDKWDVYCKGYHFIIPKGFKIDFASIPRPFWVFASPATGLYRKPAAIHDYCYKTKIISRKEADDLFLENMKFMGVNVIKRNIIYWAVRIFGKGAYL